MEEGTEFVCRNGRANGANGEVAEPDHYLNNGPAPRPRGGSAFAERGDVAATRFSRLGVRCAGSEACGMSGRMPSCHVHKRVIITLDPQTFHETPIVQS